jgi:3-deoxy-manno-octulosonate cytidylyltransferase (CMP-KDO synthetase)
MRTLAVIPCRLGAARLPGKPLLELGGRTIVRWVYDATVRSGCFDEVVVATPDGEIVDEVERFGGRSMLTSPAHATGTDRVAEVADAIASDVVVNVQGDQPFVTAAALVALVRPFSGEAPPVMTTIATPLAEDLLDDPNTVKVVRDRNGDALYFSRSPIPHRRAGTEAELLHHIGLYGFERGFLSQFTALSSGPLEQAEGLEQLRALENGFRIRVELADASPVEINTPEDLRRAEALLAERSA